MKNIKHFKYGKQVCAFVLSAMMCLVAVPTAFASILQDDKSIDSAIDSYSMGEIETIVCDFLETHYPDLVIGTPEFYEFAVNQLLGERDEELCNLDTYPLIHIYLSEYKLQYEDFALCQAMVDSTDSATRSALREIVDDNDSIVYNEASGDLSFILSDTFKAETIADIKAENQAKEVELVKDDNGVMSAAISGYNGSAAASYGIAHGKQNTYNTPAYPHYPDLAHPKYTDCTNFVSQCLAAGGLSTVGSSVYEEIVDSTTKWYCTHMERYTGQGPIYHYYGLSTSWLRVSDFSIYMTNRIGSNNVKTYPSLSDLNNNCKVGDPVLLVNQAGSAYHAVIITSKSTNYANTKYSAHTNDRSNEPITGFDAQNSYRVFKM